MAGHPQPRLTMPRCPRCSKLHRIDLPCWNGRYVTRLVRLVLAEMGDTCWLCHQPGAATIDHVIFRSVGGGDDLDNLRPAHRSCNSARGANAAYAARLVRAVDDRAWFL